jgi:hypothetical protein
MGMKMARYTIGEGADVFRAILREETEMSVGKITLVHRGNAYMHTEYIQYMSEVRKTRMREGGREGGRGGEGGRERGGEEGKTSECAKRTRGSVQTAEARAVRVHYACTCTSYSRYYRRLSNNMQPAHFSHWLAFFRG